MALDTRRGRCTATTKGMFPWVTIRHDSGARADTRAAHYSGGDWRAERTLVPAGTPFSWSSASLGKIAVAGWNSVSVRTIAAIHVLDLTWRIPGDVVPRHLDHRSNRTLSVARARQSRGRNLNKAKSAKLLQIPLPPLAEQKRIAGILDAADALRAKRREALAQLDTLLQSTFLDMFGDPVTNPMGWEVRSLGEPICRKAQQRGRGTTSTRASLDLVTGRVGSATRPNRNRIDVSEFTPRRLRQRSTSMAFFLGTSCSAVIVGLDGIA